jgi:hypothetical protein
MAARDTLSPHGNETLRKEIEAYWKERGYVVNLRTVKAVDLPRNPVYGIQSDLDMYMPPLKR